MSFRGLIKQPRPDYPFFGKAFVNILTIAKNNLSNSSQLISIVVSLHGTCIALLSKQRWLTFRLQSEVPDVSASNESLTQRYKNLICLSLAPLSFYRIHPRGISSSRVKYLYK